MNLVAPIFFWGMKDALLTSPPLEVEAITVTGQHLTTMEFSGYIIATRMWTAAALLLDLLWKTFWITFVTWRQVILAAEFVGSTAIVLLMKLKGEWLIVYAHMGTLIWILMTESKL